MKKIFLTLTCLAFTFACNQQRTLNDTASDQAVNTIVTHLRSSVAEISSFQVEVGTDTGDVQNVDALINNDDGTIQIEIPMNGIVDLGSIKSRISFKGDMVDCPNGNVIINSSVKGEAQNLLGDAIYMVTAEDGSTRSYKVLILKGRHDVDPYSTLVPRSISLKASGLENQTITKGTTYHVVAVGEYLDLNAESNSQEFRYRDISDQVTWSSSDTSKITVDTYGDIKAVAAGTAIVTAKLGNVEADIPLTVVPATPPVLVLKSIKVSPENISIVSGHTQQYVVIGRYLKADATACLPEKCDYLYKKITTAVQWSVGNSKVAVINSSGLATGVSPAGGKTSIQATVGSNSAITALGVIGNGLIVSGSY